MEVLDSTTLTVSLTDIIAVAVLWIGLVVTIIELRIAALRRTFLLELKEIKKELVEVRVSLDGSEDALHTINTNVAIVVARYQWEQHKRNQ